MRIIITGSAGTIGNVLMRGLKEKHELIGIDYRYDAYLGEGDGIALLDLANEASKFDVLIEKTNPDALIHLAWDVREGGAGLNNRLDDTTWKAHESNERMIRNVLGSVVRHRVPRLILASSVHAAIGHLGGYEYPVSIRERTRHRAFHRRSKISVQDGPAASGLYGATKVWMEEMAHAAAMEASGALTVIAVRFGNVRPDDDAAQSEYPFYLSHRDCVQFIERCLQVRFLLSSGIFAISDNACNPFDISDAYKAIGYKPTDGTPCPFND